MITREQFLEAQINIPEDINLDIVEANVFKFIMTMNNRMNDELKSSLLVIKSKRFFENSFIAIKSLIEPTKNNHLDKHEGDYQKFIQDTGRWSKTLDDLEREIRNNLDTRFSNSTAMKMASLTEQLKEGMENLVLNPLIRTKQRFYLELKKGEEKKKIVSQGEESNLFSYLLFLDMLRTAETLGMFTREEGARRKLGLGDSSIKKIVKDTNKQEFPSLENEEDMDSFFTEIDEVEESSEQLDEQPDEIQE